jgi:hypothetical protein
MIEEQKTSTEGKGFKSLINSHKDRYSHISIGMANS